MTITIQQIGSDLKVPMNEFDGKVTYGEKKKNIGSGYQDHVKQLKPMVEALAKLEAEGYVRAITKRPQKLVYGIGGRAGVPLLIEHGFAPRELAEQRLRDPKMLREQTSPQIARNGVVNNEEITYRMRSGTQNGRAILLIIEVGGCATLK